jgi:hypothetical protein
MSLLLSPTGWQLQNIDFSNGNGSLQVYVDLFSTVYDRQDFSGLNNTSSTACLL